MENRYKRTLGLNPSRDTDCHSNNVDIQFDQPYWKASRIYGLTPKEVIILLQREASIA
jgi:hypothetical protein